MKKTIKMNERELHRLISESVKRVLNESLAGDSGNYRVYDCSEIFKEYDGHKGQVSRNEIKLIKTYSPKYKVNEDPANGYIAFALDFKDENRAFDLVDRLNEISDGWYVGDETEEYVFVD